MKLLIMFLLLITLTGCNNNVKTKYEIMEEYKLKYKMNYDYDENSLYKFTLKAYNKYDNNIYKEDMTIEVKGIGRALSNKFDHGYMDMYLDMFNYELNISNSIKVNNSSCYHYISDSNNIYGRHTITNKVNNKILNDTEFIYNNYRRNHIIQPFVPTSLNIGTYYYLKDNNIYDTNITTTDNFINLTATVSSKDPLLLGVFNRLFDDDIVKMNNMEFKAYYILNMSIVNEKINNINYSIKYIDNNGNLFSENIGVIERVNYEQITIDKEAPLFKDDINQLFYGVTLMLF